MEAPPPIKSLQANLVDEKAPIGQRMQTVFYLKLHGGEKAIDALVTGLKSKSVLLCHEIAYVLGQMKDPYAIQFLNALLSDEEEHPVVRHEAAEALAAIGQEESLEILEKYKDSEVSEVSETCKLSIQTLKYKLANKEAKFGGKYMSVDPAPPSKNKTVKELAATLVDQKLELFDRYRAMFALRDEGSEEAVLALAKAFEDPSAVVRHEIAYVMGQMQHPASAPFLIKILKNDKEHAMVRHEAAEALGSVADDKGLQLLEEYKKDGSVIVEESCKVALDIAAYWQPEEEEVSMKGLKEAIDVVEEKKEEKVESETTTA